MQIPTEGLAQLVANLAKEHGVVYTRTAVDDLAEVATKLTGDHITLDNTYHLIVALKKAKKISSKQMVALVVNHQRELKTKGI